jgi:hypothetical protein
MTKYANTGDLDADATFEHARHGAVSIYQNRAEAGNL